MPNDFYWCYILYNINNFYSLLVFAEKFLVPTIYAERFLQTTRLSPAAIFSAV